MPQALRRVPLKVITALNRGENALLESPTGTGKTLALLCSALAWQRKQQANSNGTKIYYASRTHKQLAQVIKELKKTEYSNLKMTVLGSREQMCINESVRRQDDCIEGCRRAIALQDDPNGCQFHANLMQMKPNELREVIRESLFQAGAIRRKETFDIEDIKKIGNDKSICPYFATTRILAEDAVVIFCPYNYLTDLSVRKYMNIKFDNNAVVIIDEAHNLEQQCREAAHFCITEEELSTDFKLFDTAASSTDNETLPIEAYRAFRQLCKSILDFMETGKRQNAVWNKNCFPEVYITDETGSSIRNRLISFGLTREKKRQYIKYITDIENTFENLKTKNERRKRLSLSLSAPKVSLNSVEKIMKFTKYFFSCKGKFMDDFRMGFTRKDSSIALKVWCMNPAVAFNFIGSKVHSVILASGTLSPLDTFQSELGVSFQHCLQNNHILPPERMLVRSVRTGPDDACRMNFSYTSRKNEKLTDELGQLVLALCQATPSGVLCFFPSYSYLQDVEQRWKATDLYYQIHETKSILCEPRHNCDTANTLERFRQLVDDGNGALLLAVYRGKVSEGMDFEDEYARLVICIGMPFPNLKDPDIKLKMDYNDEERSKNPENRLQSGQGWYQIQAFRAVNQALGRCLRHRRDWASLILVDERYANSRREVYLSKWIQDNISHVINFRNLVKDVREFSARFVDYVANESSLTAAINDLRLSENWPLATSTPIQHSLNNSRDGFVEENVERTFRRSSDISTQTEDMDDSFSEEETNSAANQCCTYYGSKSTQRIVGKYAIFNNSLN